MQIDAQAQARAHRLGQTKPVLVLRLKTADSVEARVLAVAGDKRSFADRCVLWFVSHASKCSRWPATSAASRLGKLLSE